MGMAFERLTAIKEYRTPRAFRSFARVYILLVGAMYGPDYIMLARSDDGDEASTQLGHVVRGQGRRSAQVLWCANVTCRCQRLGAAGAGGG